MEIGIDELLARLEDSSLAIVDVRTPDEYVGTRGAPCDPRQGHIPGARNVDVGELARSETVEDVQALVGLPAGAEVATYCHSGSRSALAAQILQAAGYEARNYAGSWHEWSRRFEAPVEA